MLKALLKIRQPEIKPVLRELPEASNELAYSSLSTAIYGLGGLGVVGLTRTLAEALQSHFPRVATTETRGIAQRRAPVRSIVRAGADVRSATIPPSSINLVVSLESGEVLRAASLLQPGTRCLHTDLVIPCSGSGMNNAMPEVGVIRAMLKGRGVDVMPLDVADWLQEHRMSDVLVSTIAFGALSAMIGLPLDECEALLIQRMHGKMRDDNQAAFRHGAAQYYDAKQAAALTLPHELPAASSLMGMMLGMA